MILLTPKIFFKIQKILIPTLLVITPITIGLGIYYALFNSPPDYQQGEMVRMMYIHVPSAWMSLAIYSFIGICSIITLIYRTRMTYIYSVASAPVGAVFCLITLITGSIWGKPIWGTWWVWDARLTSTLILFLLYLSYIAIIRAGSLQRSEKPASVMAIIGLINVPIVKFSVNIWYSLHQPASVIRFGKPSIDKSMLIALIIMSIGFILLSMLIILLRSKKIIKKISLKNQIISK